MPMFSYKAKSPDGRVIDGQLDVDSEATLAARLKAQKMTLVSATKQGGLAYIFKLGPRVSAKSVSIFSRQFATMISAGLPVLQSLNILVDQNEEKVFKQVIAKVRDDIGSGANLSDAMSKFPNVFNPLYCNMIKAGELSGALDTILDRLSGFLEKAENLKNKVKGALTYPATIAVVALIIVIFLMVKVVPTFKMVFDSFGGKLPIATLALLWVSEFEQKYAVYQIAGIVIAVMGLGIAKRTEKGALAIDAFILKTPIFGDLTKKSAVATFARTMGTLLKSGVGILDALETVARASSNKVVEKALLETRAAVREGQPLTEPMKATKLFPGMVIQMISVGEETGQLDEMLLKMSDFYDEEVEVAIEAIMSMIEPMIMSVLGVMIGWILIAMFIPMFTMSSMVS
jgi:type IV pilus assembly protein PilC